MLHFINLYNNPNRAAPARLRFAIPCLLQFLPLLPTVRLIQGDFNLHCSYWDPLVEHDDPLGWQVINDLTVLGLALVNDDGIATFFWPPYHLQVLDLLWLHEDAPLPLTIDISFALTGTQQDHKELSLLCHDIGDTVGTPRLTAPYLPSGLDEELNVVLFILAASDQWAHGSVNEQARALINLFDVAWVRFAKTGIVDGQFNKWWNTNCALAKACYNEQLCMCTRLAFQVACKAAKKVYFAQKLEDMVKQCKPWLGMHWIKDRPIPKVPQIQTAQGSTINKLQPMFEAFQGQFQPNLASDCDASHAYLQALLAKPPRTFNPFSAAELHEALSSCSSSSAPGPSHMSWALLKMFLADDTFHAQFLQLANDIVSTSTWPDAFKDLVMVIIPKPHKDDYSQVKNFRHIALLECAGKLVSKLIAARLQSDVVHFSLIHLLQFSGLKY